MILSMSKDSALVHKQPGQTCILCIPSVLTKAGNAPYMQLSRGSGGDAPYMYHARS